MIGALHWAQDYVVFNSPGRGNLHHHIVLTEPTLFFVTNESVYLENVPKRFFFNFHSSPVFSCSCTKFAMSVYLHETIKFISLNMKNIIIALY